jgi:hypothetical protein
MLILIASADISTTIVAMGAPCMPILIAGADYLTAIVAINCVN